MLMTWILIGACLLSLAVIAQHRIWCYREKRHKSNIIHRYSTAIEEDDYPRPPDVINESAGEEGDDSARNPLVPDSGSTEQKAVNEALNEEGEYYDEHRALLLAKRNSLQPGGRIQLD